MTKSCLSRVEVSHGFPGYEGFPDWRWMPSAITDLYFWKFESKLALQQLCVHSLLLLHGVSGRLATFSNPDALWFTRNDSSSHHIPRFGLHYLLKMAGVNRVPSLLVVAWWVCAGWHESQGPGRREEHLYSQMAELGTAANH